MLVIHLESGRVINLERSVSTVNGYGIWEYHRSQSSSMWVPDYTPYRHLAVKPPDPAIGQKVTVAICKLGAPEEEWKPFRSGTAGYDGI
ncbi:MULTISPECIES: hypothetical protein [Pseudomonas]|uniref:hypothetical protein n=1 Tax=Pseudomonas TaxID=286 RepID=UPI000370CA94|nr:MULTISPECIES: hypothetical protein [Pseudomonas]MCD4867028.1 hypothetical protein [Pseudomonas sp. PLB05]